MVPYFHVPHFPAVQTGAANSCLAFSGPAFLTVPYFHVSHFQSPLGDITWGVKFKNGSPDSDHAPFREDFSFAGWDLLFINQYKKLKSLGSPVTKLRLSVLFNFNRNYAAIWYRFRHIASHLSKVADFNLPHLHLAPPLGKTPAEIFCTSLRVVNLTAYLLHRS